MNHNAGFTLIKYLKRKVKYGKIVKVFIISKVLSNDKFCLKLSFSFRVHFKVLVIPYYPVSEPVSQRYSSTTYPPGSCLL